MRNALHALSSFKVFFLGESRLFPHVADVIKLIARLMLCILSPPKEFGSI